jgi:cyd operon protein YbgT
MWYFAWVLGLGTAVMFGILNAIWFEIYLSNKPKRRDSV